jgi:hypothetical protein
VPDSSLNLRFFYSVEIAKRTGLARNTVKKWLKAPGEVVPKYECTSVEGKLTAFEPTLHQALTTDSHRPKQGRCSGRALFAQIQAQGYRGGYSLSAYGRHSACNWLREGSYRARSLQRTDVIRQRLRASGLYWSDGCSTSKVRSENLVWPVRSSYEQL